MPEAQSPIAVDVARGLSASPKHLPPYLFYDEEGSRLYERITELPEYYLCRAERAIFEKHADEMVARAAGDAPGSPPTSSPPLSVVELGAGSAEKTEILLRAVLRRQARCLYVPIDVSASAVARAEERLAAALPSVLVRPCVTTHEQALHALEQVEPPQLLLFIGSSIGNFEDAEAASLLRGYGRALGREARLLLGTDLRKSAKVLVPAYDDAAGVTALFNKNVLVRINRELGGHFDVERFRHVARWNDEASRIEMHLESAIEQYVTVDALRMRFHFRAGETIHTESSIKYDLGRVDGLLALAGFRRDATYYDEERRFAVHLASVTPTLPRERSRAT